MSLNQLQHEANHQKADGAQDAAAARKEDPQVQQVRGLIERRVTDPKVYGEFMVMTRGDVKAQIIALLNEHFGNKFAMNAFRAYVEDGDSEPAKPADAAAPAKANYSPEGKAAADNFITDLKAEDAAKAAQAPAAPAPAEAPKTDREKADEAAKLDAEQNRRAAEQLHEHPNIKQMRAMLNELNLDPKAYVQLLKGLHGKDRQIAIGVLNQFGGDGFAGMVAKEETSKADAPAAEAAGPGSKDEGAQPAPPAPTSKEEIAKAIAPAKAAPDDRKPIDPYADVAPAAPPKSDALESKPNPYVDAPKAKDVAAPQIAPSVEVKPAQPVDAKELVGENAGETQVEFGPMRITASSLRVRTEGDTSTKKNIIGHLKRGAIVTPVGKAGDWFEISYHGTKAFIHGDYVVSVKNGKALGKGGGGDEAAEPEPEQTQAPKPPAADAAPPAAAPAPAPAPAPEVAKPPLADVTPIAGPPAPVSTADKAPAAAHPQAQTPHPQQQMTPAAPQPTMSPWGGWGTDEVSITSQIPKPASTPAPNNDKQDKQASEGKDVPLINPDMWKLPVTPQLPMCKVGEPDPVMQSPQPVAQSIPGVDAAPKHVDGKVKPQHLKLSRPLPQVNAYMPPGGAQGNCEVFLFMHGMYAHHNRPGADINDPHPEEAMHMAAAMAATQRNLVTLAPVGNMDGEWPLWSALAKDNGFKELIVQSLDQLSSLKSIQPPLAAGSISIAGHSAGGTGLGHAAEQLGDLLHDMTYEDAGYADKPGKSGWKEAHNKAAQWLLGGKTDKLLRVLINGNKKHESEASILHSHFNADALVDFAVSKLNKQITVTRDEGNKDARTGGGGMTLDHTLHIHGLEGGARTITVFHMPEVNHMGLRNEVTQHLITENRDTDFAKEDKKPVAELPKGPAVAAPTPEGGAPQIPVQEQRKDNVAYGPESYPAPTAVSEEPKPMAPGAAPKHDAVPAVPAGPQGIAPTGGGKKKGHYDDANGFDRFGNATDRIIPHDHNTTVGNDRVFVNKFHARSDARLYTSNGHKTKNHIPQGTEVKVFDVNGSYAHISTTEIPLEMNLWMKFSDIGGDGSSKPGLGNGDAQDQERAQLIMNGLPAVGDGKHDRKPGKSSKKWHFASKFRPSSEGIALDSSLMAKVNALMEWAIAEDMVKDDIVITSGVRPPKTAHKFCMRYQLAHKDGAGVDFNAIRNLPGGKYEGWKFCPHPGASNDEIKEQANNLYKEHGGGGAPAAAGFAPGSDGRSPLKDSGPKVSKHCPGHAVDVTIPWRGKDGGTDVWAYEEIYHQFGLTRPLHKDKGGGDKPEHWHVEETGKQLDTEGGEVEHEE